ncbi:MAG: hypothetical protein JKY16_02840 [Lutibacter sp.]|nr:hypothetical protein [Lutibacter sp.]
MYAIIDKRCSKEIKNNLNNYIEAVFEFSSNDITYNSISGHPDIFMFQDGKKLILAPNSPKELQQFFDVKNIRYSLGIKKVGFLLENSAHYNCVTTKKYFFHKNGIPDASIQEYCSKKRSVKFSQSYVRCSMFPLGNEKIITSDVGIVNSLKKNMIANFYFDPSEIAINDHKNGFIGGTMGRLNDTIFFLGDIFKHKDGEALHKFITSNGEEVVCLGNDYLYDGGGIFFVE